MWASSSDSCLTRNAPDSHLVALHFCLSSRKSCSPRENHGGTCGKASNYGSSTCRFSRSAQHSRPLSQELKTRNSNSNPCADTCPSINSCPLWVCGPAPTSQVRRCTQRCGMHPIFLGKGPCPKLAQNRIRKRRGCGLAEEAEQLQFEQLLNLLSPKASHATCQGLSPRQQTKIHGSSGCCHLPLCQTSKPSHLSNPAQVSSSVTQYRLKPPEHTLYLFDT